MIDARMTVGDMMSTALVTMRANDTIGRADMEMKLANIRHILVTDDRGKLAGVISNRDIYKALSDKTHPVVVGDVMSKRVYTIRDTESARHAAALILEHKIGALPVTGEGGQLVGVVTESDFVRIAHEALGGKDWETL